MVREENRKLQKTAVILGPTACGKTAWSLRLAKKFNGEIISADSRQIYKKMNVGTAKEEGEWRWVGLRRIFHIQDIPHYLIDMFDPGEMFTVAQFRDKAVKYIKLIHQRDRLPLLVGGTGLYISAVTDNFIIPKVPPNKKLRRSLEEKSREELLIWLEKLDPQSAQEIDRRNQRRIIRALEVCILSGRPFSRQRQKGEPIFNTLRIGIDLPREELHRRIEERVEKMLANGLLNEVRALRKQKYSWDLPSLSAIGYRQFKDYFDNKIDLAAVAELLKKNTKNYAKRQLTWFRRDPSIHWCEEYEEAEKLLENFIKE